MLWPTDTNIADLLPRPDRRVFRTVYMGLVDPRTIAASVISSLAYFDEIVVINPFPNPRYMKPEYSPTQSPGQHKSQTLKNVSVLLALEPFIDAGLVHLAPDPAEFNVDFRRALFAMSSERTANFKLTKEEMRRGEALLKDNLERWTLRLPDDDLRRKVRESQPEVSSELVERTIEFMKEKLANDPFALLQPVTPGEDGGELQALRCMNLELALFFAQLSGSAIYTDELASWRQLHEHASAAKDVAQNFRWAPLAKKLSSLALSIELNPLINLETRNARKLSRVRRVFGRIWNAAMTDTKDVGIDEIERKLANRLGEAYDRDVTEWKACTTTTTVGPSARFRRHMDLSAPGTGFATNGVQRLLITFGRTNHLKSVPMALRLTPEDVAGDLSE